MNIYQKIVYGKPFKSMQVKMFLTQGQSDKDNLNCLKIELSQSKTTQFSMHSFETISDGAFSNVQGNSTFTTQGHREGEMYCTNV